MAPTPFPMPYQKTHVNIAFTWLNLARFQAQVTRVIKEAPAAAQNIIVKKIAFDVLAALISLSRVDTGRYRAAWQAAGEAVDLKYSGKGSGGSSEGVAKGWSEGKGRKGIGPGGKPFVELINGVHYSLALEFGTGPHVIEPVHKQALHWTDKGGQGHFAKRVMHPGTKGYRILGRAMQRGHKALSRSSFKRFLGPSAK